MNRADRLKQRARAARQHRRLRAHRPAAPPRLQPRGDLPVALNAASAAPRATTPREARRGTRRADLAPARRRSARQGRASIDEDSRISAARSSRPRGGASSTRRRPRGRSPSSRRDRELARPGRARRSACAHSGHRRKWTELRELLAGQRRCQRRRRRPAQADHLHRAPRHAQLPRSTASARCSARPRRSSRSTAASAARSAARHRGALHPGPGLSASSSPPTPPARA